MELSKTFGLVAQLQIHATTPTTAKHQKVQLLTKIQTKYDSLYETQISISCCVPADFVIRSGWASTVEK